MSLHERMHNFCQLNPQSIMNQNADIFNEWYAFDNVVFKIVVILVSLSALKLLRTALPLTQ